MAAGARVSMASRHRKKINAYSIFLLAGELTRCLEVHPKNSELTLVTLVGVLDSIDVEGHRKAMDRQDDSLSLAINEDLMTMLELLACFR